MKEIIEQFTVAAIERTAPSLGQIRAYAGETIPDGWLLCDRRMLRRHVYPELFRVLGTKYGDGDGSNTAFNLPGNESPESEARNIIFVGMLNKNA
jgi:microcystin-dependent protein